MRLSLLNIVLAVSALLMFNSCIKEDWGIIPDYQSQKGNSGEWNKNKTVDLYYVSSLSDNSMTDYNSVGSYLKKLGDNCTASIVDRTDVQYYQYPYFSNNICTNLSVAANKFTCFAFNQSAPGNIEGSSILFNHKINSASSFKITDNCYVKYVPIMTHSSVETPVDIEMPLATVRFSQADQVSASTDVLKQLASNTYQAVLIGTVKNDLAEQLQSVAKGIGASSFTLVTKNPDNAYQIFMFAPSSWVLRETTVDGVSGKVNAYKMSIEASVE